MRRGALDFDLPEAKVVLDPTTGSADRRARGARKIPGVKKAYQLIEELMLLANELVARWLVERDVPAIFRVHGAARRDQARRASRRMCESSASSSTSRTRKIRRSSRALLKKLRGAPADARCSTCCSSAR